MGDIEKVVEEKTTIKITNELSVILTKYSDKPVSIVIARDRYMYSYMSMSVLEWISVNNAIATSLEDD